MPGDEMELASKALEREMSEQRDRKALGENSRASS
jgi:hypothetical protein